MAEPIIKAALDTIEIVFYHKWEIQTGDNRKCCNAKKMIVKILNSRTIPEQAWKSGFFKYISSTKKIQNNSRSSRNSKTIGHPETLYMELHTSPQLFFIAPN